MERRLAAILAADLVGYSRLMGEDEEGTLVRLDRLKAEVLDPLIADHRGRVVKLMGDGLLVEFHSVADALACALQWQARVEKEARREPDERALRYRIGINLGDVIIKGDDIFGAGVNLAARLETFAEPGGLCISQPVFDQMEAKLRAGFEDLGVHPMKNLARPVRVWRWQPEGPAGKSAQQMRPERVPLSEKPAIAVLPFRNLSPDPDQEYFADGITEEILTLLARDRWLVVIARSSTFLYKDKPVDLRTISKELGANYLLEGSVRKAGTSVRISAQLSRGSDAHHIWSDRYDGDLEQIFEVQDQIAAAIAAAISPALGVAQREIARRKPPQSLDAWDYCWQGLWHYYKFTTEELTEAERLFEKALAIDPQFPQALTCLAYANVEKTTHLAETHYLKKAMALARMAIALDERDPWAHYVLGRALSDGLQYREAIAEFERAIELNPSLALAYFGLGYTLIWCNREREAIDLLAKAERLSPHDPELWHFYDMRATAHLSLRELEPAELYTRKALRQPNCTFWPYAMLASILGRQGRAEDAKAAAAALLEKRPNYTCRQARQDLYFCGNQTFIEYFIDGLRQSRIPE